MGDRANIYVKNNKDTGVYLYSHWGGSDMALTAQAALAKKMRWDDEAYLTRIIFCVMVKDAHSEETGYGIATYAPDNEYPIIEIDCQESKISFGGKAWTFAEYVELPKEELQREWDAAER